MSVSGNRRKVLCLTLEPAFHMDYETGHDQKEMNEVYTMVDVVNKTFELSDMDDKFWNRVIFINIWKSSGLGGPGCLWIITDDKKEYVISFQTFPHLERHLGELTPILKYKEKDFSYEHPYESEGNGWKYVKKEMLLLRDDFYDAFITVYNDVEKRKLLGWKKDHMPLLAGIALGLGEEPDRFNELEATRLWEQEAICREKYEAERKKQELTEEYFDWKAVYPNNIRSNGEEGIYALIFKDNESKTVGYKFSIIYQREEISPLHRNSRIEAYNLFEMRYDDVQGPLAHSNADNENEFKQALDYSNRFIYSNTFSNCEVNSYGEFVRSFSTLEEAKAYAIAITNIRNYVNKENIITDLDNPARVCRNRLRKYGAILEFGKVYEQIIKIVCEYEPVEENTAGGGWIFAEIMNRTGMDKEILREMWKYIPLVLSKEAQESAYKIVAECKDFLKEADTKEND